MRTTQQISNIFQRFEQANPHPVSELIYQSPYELLVAVVLSAQATDVSVNRATKNLFPVANTPQKMLALGETKLKSHIKSIGLYQNKARFIIATSQALIDKHSGQVPHTRAALEALPGVGRKSANVLLNILFGEPTLAVDTHIFRVANRTGLAIGKTPLSVERGLVKVIPDTYRQHAHHWLVLHGRYVCRAKKPDCESCLIKDLCERNDFPSKSA